MFFQLLPKLLLVCDLSSLLLLPNWKEQQIVLQSVKNFHSTQMVMSQSQALPHIRAWRYLFVSVPALEFIKKQSSDVATLMWLFWPQCDFQQVLRLGWAVLVLMRYKVTKVLGWSALGWIEETSKMLFSSCTLLLKVSWFQFMYSGRKMVAQSTADCFYYTKGRQRYGKVQAALCC